MKPPAASVWLDAWERGMSVAPVSHPTVLLEAFHGAESEPWKWPLGRREAALLRLRGALFGNVMESVTTCPHCGKMVEFTLRADELLAAAPALETASVSVEGSGMRAEFRLPDTLDLEAAADVPLQNRRRFLLDRCHDGPSPDWPEEFIDAASREMAVADPMGDVILRLSCPDCEKSWGADFDTGTFLWAELTAWAKRLMTEIHVIASAYGWTESEILELPPHRRSYYLERLHQS